MQLAFYEAIARLPLGVVVTLEFTGPLLVGLCCSRKGLDVLWILLAATGVVLLGGLHTTADPVGVVASLVTGAALAGYVLLGSAVSRVTSQLSGLAMAMAVASVVAVPGAALIGLPATGALVSPTILLAALGVALFATVVPFSLEYLAMRHGPTPGVRRARHAGSCCPHCPHCPHCPQSPCRRARPATARHSDRHTS